MVVSALAVVLGLGYLAGVMNAKDISLADALWGKGIPSLTAGSITGGSTDGSGSGSGSGSPDIDGAHLSYVINYGGSVTVWSDREGMPTYRLIENGMNVLVDNSDSPTMTINPTLGGFEVRIDDSVPSSTETTIVNGFWSADIHGTDLSDGTIRIYSNNPYGFSDYTLYRDGLAVKNATNPDFTVTDAGSHNYVIHDGKDIVSQTFSTSAFASHPSFYVASANYALAQHDGTAGYTNKFGAGGWKAVTKDASGNIWGLRNGTNIVYEYSPSGTQLRTFTVLGTAPTNTYCYDIHVDDARGVVYLADAATTAGQAGIIRYTTAGAYIGEWTTANRPYAIALDSTGNIYCAESAANRIRVIDPSGTQLRTWGSAGAGDGQFSANDGIAVDKSDDTVYVLDRGNLRIQAFTKNGTYLRKWSLAGEFGVNDPSGIALDLDGNVYVTNSQVSANRVVAYSSTGTKLGVLTGMYAYGAKDIVFVAHIDPSVLH
jgi:streptogramin lyase